MLARRKRSAGVLADPAEQGEPMQTQPQTELRGLDAGIVDHIVWDDAGMDVCVSEASGSVAVPAAGSQSASSRKAPSSARTPARKIAGRLRGSRQRRTPKSNQESASEDEFSDAPTNREDAADRPPCPGCRRIFEVHACFLSPNKKVKWVYSDGRGLWCYDCHRTWRICFQHDHPLSWMKSWLEASPDNFDLWTLHFVAVLQLHAEGPNRQGKVKLQQVQARIESNKLAFRMLNLPTGAGCDRESAGSPTAGLGRCDVPLHCGEIGATGGARWSSIVGRLGAKCFSNSPGPRGAKRRNGRPQFAPDLADH